MIEISEVAKTPQEKRKAAAEEAYVEFLKGYPLFEEKSKDELIMLTWLFEYSLIGFKANIEADAGSIIILLDGEIHISSSKKGILRIPHHHNLQEREMHVSRPGQTFSATRDSQILLLKSRNNAYLQSNSHRSIRQETEFLMKCQFSRHLHEEDIKRVLSRGRFQPFQMGQSVYSKGMDCKGFYIVRRGSFVLKKSLLIGGLFYKKIKMSELFEGEVVGYSQLIECQDKRQNQLVCNTAYAELIYLKKQHFSLFRPYLTQIHEGRKAANSRAQKKSAETLSSVLPFVSPVKNQQRLFRVPTGIKATRYLTQSFMDSDTEQQTFFKNSYSNTKLNQGKKSISNRKFKSKPLLEKLNETSQLKHHNNTNSYTVCQTMTNEEIHQKHTQFQKFRKKKAGPEIETPFKELARSFRNTYQQQKLKQICQGGCKRNCRKRYL